MGRKVLLLMCSSLIFLSACGTMHAEIEKWEPSEIYTDEEIEEACEAVEDYFSRNFDGCVLTKLYYPGDDFADRFDKKAKQYNADEAIVIFSNFDVGSSGGDGSLTPNSTYRDWTWTLVRDDEDDWEIVANGYA